MFEILIVVLLCVLVVQLFAVKRAITDVGQFLAQLATSPIRHHVEFETDISRTLNEIQESVASIEVHLTEDENVEDYPGPDDLWPDRRDIDPFVEPKFERAVTRAGHQFHARKYENVVKLLGPYEQQLSRKQLKMLNDAKAQAAQTHKTK